jgi:hypothetical protein
VKDILNSIHKDVQRTLPALTSQLRQSAHGHGWPVELSSSLNVGFSNNSFRIEHPEELKSHIQDWEYGNERRRPTAVLRKFSNRLDSSAHSHLNKAGK